MANFPSVYLEIQDIRKRLNEIFQQGVDLVGPSSGILKGYYPNPEALTGYPVPLTGSLEMTDNLTVSGDVIVSGGITGSFMGDGNKITNIPETAVNNLSTYANKLQSNIFSGNQTITGSLSVSQNLIASENLVADNAFVLSTRNILNIYNYSGNQNIEYKSRFGGSHIFSVASASDGSNSLVPKLTINSLSIDADVALTASLGAKVSGLLDLTSATITGSLLMTSGDGIDFSNNTSYSGMTNEILNDYEEGTWTPSLDFNWTNAQVWAGSAKYTKIGRMVTAKATITATSGHTTFDFDQTSYLSGLPYSCPNITAAFASCENGGNSPSVLSCTIDGTRFNIQTDGGSALTWMYIFFTYYV